MEQDKNSFDAQNFNLHTYMSAKSGFIIKKKTVNFSQRKFLFAFIQPQQKCILIVDQCSPEGYTFNQLDICEFWL